MAKASFINTLDLFGYPAANLAALEWLDTAVFGTALARTRPIGSLVYRLIADNAIQSTHISRITQCENILLVGAFLLFCTCTCEPNLLVWASQWFLLLVASSHGLAMIRVDCLDSANQLALQLANQSLLWASQYDPIKTQICCKLLLLLSLMPYPTLGFTMSLQPPPSGYSVLLIRLACLLTMYLVRYSH